MSWTVKPKLSRDDIAQIVDALAEERDHTGAAPSELEDRLSNLLQSCDLGWHAGVWPERITIDGVLYTRGSVQVDRREGELLSVTYNPASINHPPLTLFND